MKATRLGLIFAFVFLCLMVPDNQKAMEVNAVNILQNAYNRALDQAVEDAVTGLVEKDDGRIIWLNKEETVKRFFTSLAINMNKMDSKSDRERLYHYVPLVLVIEKERLFVGSRLWEPVWEEYRFSKEYGDMRVSFSLGNYVVVDNEKTGERIEGDYHDLKEQIYLPFLETEEAFEEERRKVITDLLTECFQEKAKEYNEIAKQYGISYELVLPVINLEEWYRTIDDVGFVALFQGYPYGNSYTGYYNRMALGGARLYKE